MKKLILAMFVILGVSIVKADELGDQIKATLIDHIQLMNQFTTTGQNRVAGLDDVIQIGKIYDTYIASIQGGGFVQTNESGDKNLEGYLIGGSVRIDPFIKKYVKLQPEWQFLNSLIISSGYHYSTKEHKGVLSYVQLSLAFGLNPKQ